MAKLYVLIAVSKTSGELIYSRAHDGFCHEVLRNGLIASPGFLNLAKEVKNFKMIVANAMWSEKFDIRMMCDMFLEDAIKSDTVLADYLDHIYIKQYTYTDTIKWLSKIAMYNISDKYGKMIIGSALGLAKLAKDILNLLSMDNINLGEETDDLLKVTNIKITTKDINTKLAELQQKIDTYEKQLAAVRSYLEEH